MNKNKFIAIFQGQIFSDSTKMFNALLENWDAGKEYVFNGNLNYRAEIQKDYLDAFKEKQTLTPKEQEYTDIIFFRLMYSLEYIERFYWKNQSFASLEEYGNELANLALRLLKTRTFDMESCTLPEAKMTSTEARMIKGAEDFLYNDIWDYYLTKRCYNNDSSISSLYKQQADSYREQFNRLKIFYGAIDLDPCIKALGIAHELTGREDFVIEDQYFSSIAEFNDKVKNIYDNNLNDYFQFFAKGASDLEALQEIFPKEKFQEFHKHFPARDNFLVLNNGEYMFRNVKELYEYIKKLADGSDLTELKTLRDNFLTSIKDNLLKIESRMRPYTRKIIDIMESIICTDKQIFKDIDELIEYLETFASCGQVNKIFDFLMVNDTALYNCYHNMSPSKAIEFGEQLNSVYHYLERAMIKKDFMSVIHGNKTYQVLNPDHRENSSENNNRTNQITRPDISVPNISYINNKEFPLEDALTLVPGETVYFGKYYKDDTEKKGFFKSKDLEWKVIHSDSQTALLITTTVVDSRFFNAEQKDVNWENCEVREWLNTEFFSTVFSPEQRIAILPAIINNSTSEEDYIFLLSSDEVNKYIQDEQIKFCPFSEYAKAKGLTHLGFNPQKPNQDEPNFSCWWLRSTIINDVHTGAFIINQDGKCELERQYTNGIGIRPAMWVNLNLIKKLSD